MTLFRFTAHDVSLCGRKKKKKMLYEPKTILFYLKNWDKSNRTFCTISGIEIIDSLGFLFHGQRIPGTCIQAVKRGTVIFTILSYLNDNCYCRRIGGRGGRPRTVVLNRWKKKKRTEDGEKFWKAGRFNEFEQAELDDTKR